MLRPYHKIILSTMFLTITKLGERREMIAEKLCIIGTGSWGTTLAVLFSRQGLNVSLWARTAEEAAALNARRENVDFLPGIPFPRTLHVAHDLSDALRDARIVLMVVPAQTFRTNVRQLRDLISARHIVVSATKGIELDTMQRMTEIIHAELPQLPPARIAVLSGPNIAREIAAGLPASTVVACGDENVARVVQEQTLSPTFRVYTHDDVIGVELAGALKNVIAIVAGVADGLNVGENAKATVLTRGLAEISRLGVALGANPLTFMGLAGIGDLMCTCNSRHSRNHTVGEKLAQGEKIEQIVSGMKMVAEGITTTKAAHQLGAKHQVEMPLIQQMYEVLFEDKSPRQAIGDLMLREEIVTACREGRFHVWAVRTVDEGIEILTGVPAGRLDGDGAYPDGTVNARVARRLEDLDKRFREFAPLQPAEAPRDEPPKLGPPKAPPQPPTG